MKQKIKTLLIVTLSFAITIQAQDTLQVFRAGKIVSKYPVTEIDSITFKLDTKIIRDYDGNIYTPIVLGSQTWLLQNLRTTHYRNGEIIPNLTSANSWESTMYGAQCAFNNTTNNDTITKYGLLYNWLAVSDSRNIAPLGWHVATDNDWKTLIKYLSSHGYNYDQTITNDSTASNKLGKAIAGTNTWYSSSVTGAIGNNLTTNNKSGFSAYPSIYRKNIGDFTGTSPSCAIWWTSSYDNNFGNPICWSISYAISYINKGTNLENYGFAVRCVKD
jgi:uncharacterized protein (TIGR02145 family)